MISRHFLLLDGRLVHYRRSGQGPALVLLHASPVSSKVFEPMMRFMSQHFTCLAFDTPSNGLSESLAVDDPDMTDYADAQAAVLGELNIQECILYGRHTGASIAVELANRHPDLVKMVMTDGYPVFTKEQSEQYLSGYLSDLPLEEDGSHLTWVWNRYRDQFVFWPWNKRVKDTIADTDMPSASFLQNGVVALLEAGNNYKYPYRAVFKHNAMECLDEVTVPVCIAARPGDSLHRKFADFPETYWCQEMPRDFQEACIRERDTMLQHRPQLPAPPVPKAPVNGPCYLDTGREQLYVWRAGKGDIPLVVLADMPGSLIWHSELLESLSGTRRVIAIDPAGCGESDAAADRDVSVERQADRIIAVLAALHVQSFDLLGIEAGASLSLEVARRAADRAQSITWLDPMLIDEDIRRCIPGNIKDIKLEADGSHLTQIWMQERDNLVWFPWFDRRVANQRKAENICLDFQQLQSRVESLNKQVDSYSSIKKAAWEYPLALRAEFFLPMFEGQFQLYNSGRGQVPAGFSGYPDYLPEPLAADNLAVLVAHFSSLSNFHQSTKGAN